MKNKLGFLVTLSMLLIFGLSFSSCTTTGRGIFPPTASGTNITTPMVETFPRKPLVRLIGIPKYTVVGSVTLEKKWFGILGVTIPLGPLPSIDVYAYQNGGITYADLLNEAKKLYGDGDVDAVIDINVAYSGSNYFIFYAQRKSILTGIAIKYSRDEVGETGGHRW